MPNLLYIHFIIYLLFAMHIFWFGAAGVWLIYNHREQHDRSRLYVACCFFYLAVGCIVFIATAMFRGDLSGFMDTILEPYPLLISFLPILTFPLYLLEIMHSQWMTWKRFLLIVSPWLVLCLSWLIYHGMHHWQYSAITHLSHVCEIMANIHKPDVLLRVLLAVIYFPYGCAILFVRHNNWRTTNVSAARLKVLKGLVVLCFFGFIIGMVLRIHSIMFMYFVVLDFLTIYIIAVESTERIPVPLTPSPLTSHPSPFTPHPSPLTPHPSPLTLHPSPNPATDAPALSLLAQRLQQQMDLGIWQNPDLDRDDICRLLGTNRTYLASAIQELGFTNLRDMFNKQRVQYIHDELLHNPDADLADVIYRAGFRNRATAVNCFKQVYNCKPSELAKVISD